MPFRSSNCQYTILAQQQKSMIQWCHKCQTFQLLFNNLLMGFTPKSFEIFKTSVSECYQYHSMYSTDRNLREIYFKTPEKDLYFIFSTNEVASLLDLLQSAALEFMALELSDTPL